MINKTITKSVSRLLIITIFLSFIIWIIRFNHPQTGMVKPVNSSVTDSPFFDQQLFNKSIAQANNINTVFKYQPAIIVIPHHLTAGYIIADLISAASKYSYRQIYLIGPNHREYGSQKMTTPDSIRNTEIINTDHSIGNPLLFINHFFPQSEIKKIVLKRNVNSNDIRKWTNSLTKDVSRNTLYIFSLDFSHFLPANIAAIHDDKTIKLIQERDIPQILTLSNEHVDSPSGLALCISVADKLKLHDPYQIHHTNSGFLSSNFSSGVTSYLGLVFFKNPIN